MKMMWDDSLVLGIRDIDEQHEQFIGLVNTLYDKIVNHAPKTEIYEVLVDIYNDAAKHFRFEEMVFKVYSYSLAIEHQKLHELILERLNQYLAEFNKDISDTMQMVIAVDIKVLLVNHIKIHDAKFVSECKEQKWSLP